MKKTSILVVVIIILAVVIGYILFWPKPSSAPAENQAPVVKEPTPTTVIPPATQDQKGLYQNAEFGFQFSYPDSFILLSEDGNARLPWSYDSTLSGRRIVTVELSKDFQPKTNFSGASVSVGVTNNKTEVAACLSGDQGKVDGTMAINGREFTAISLNDAAAGNRYETISYRLVKDGMCFALEQTIHSTNLANYPAEKGIKEFDKARVLQQLGSVTKSFAFTK